MRGSIQGRDPEVPVGHEPMLNRQMQLKAFTVQIKSQDHRQASLRSAPKPHSRSAIRGLQIMKKDRDSYKRCALKSNRREIKSLKSRDK